MTPNRKSTSPTNKNISISGDVRDSNVFIGDNNTIIQKFFNIFKSDSETLEHRNRRILLGHVENAWIKGVLDASLHGAALLDLGIKQDPEAVTKYPWAIKKESTDETLPAGISMREIFDSIGMGRSLLILGAPGSGKTTMLLELARGLIARAREDVTYPIPMVFNLASWTEKLTLADWLAQELNNLYSVPRKTAPNWVKGNKLLLLLDGLDEVRQESRAKCVEAINTFRKQNGLTSLAVCSRSQDYADLNAKLSFEGAVEVQPLNQKQITEFFTRFGDEMAGIKQALEKDSGLREMAETPLFLSIMIMTYRGKQVTDILISQGSISDQNIHPFLLKLKYGQDIKKQRKHLFDTYIKRMLERPRSKNMPFKKQDMLHWLTWLAKKMIEKKQYPYLIEQMGSSWLNNNWQKWQYRIIWLLVGGLVFGLVFGTFYWFIGGQPTYIVVGIFTGMLSGFVVSSYTSTNDYWLPPMRWSWSKAKQGLIPGLIAILSPGIMIGVSVSRWGGHSVGQVILQFIDDPKIQIGSIARFPKGITAGFNAGVNTSLTFGLGIALLGIVFGGFQPIIGIEHPKKKFSSLIKSAIFSFPAFGLTTALSFLLYSQWAVFGSIVNLPIGIFLSGILAGFLGWFLSNGLATTIFFVLIIILSINNLLPLRLIPFLDHCVDLIFLRRVGGGYIFVHRLLMEHFAEMYVETPASRETKNHGT